MKKLLFLFVLCTVTNFTLSAQTIISQNEFSQKMEDLIKVYVSPNQKDTAQMRISIFVTNEVDSTDIFHDFINNYNNQYSGFLFGKPFLAYDSSYPKKIANDSIKLRKLVIKQLRKQKQFYSYFEEMTAFYLHGKNIDIENFKYGIKPQVSKSEFIRTASQFCYVWRIKEDGSLQAKICGGINPFKFENATKNPMLESFAFLAVLNILENKDYDLYNRFFKELVPNMEKESENNEDTLKEIRNKVYSTMQNDEIFSVLLIQEYKSYEKYLPFVVN